MSENAIIKIKDLKVKFKTIDDRTIHALNGINLSINPKETLAIVGESGSGKTQLSLSIMNLLAGNATTSGVIEFEGKNLLSLKQEELNKIRGTKISMIFQDPMTSLNPYLKISTQMMEVLTEKQGVDAKAARQKSIEMLNLVSIPEAEKRIDQYPHQFSGGMRQRIMIAMALLSNPKVLIADEPTTALDVTIQAQILEILEQLKTTMDLAIIFITHDLGVVANIADNIAVVYGGSVVEYGSKKEIFENPKHPYTQALLKSIPRLDQKKEERLYLIDGMPSTLFKEPNFCAFKDRCPKSMEVCGLKKPNLKNIEKSQVACFLYGEN